ncbi:hypothetical protein QQX98_012498 [Neonectria punicea]|uniref:Uncharacterized protein n=1 Tax=Neonectria punicea TaxID=979145 RepID=A0ABR1GJ57_9HYPO
MNNRESGEQTGWQDISRPGHAFQTWRGSPRRIEPSSFSAVPSARQPPVTQQGPELSLSRHMYCAIEPTPEHREPLRAASHGRGSNLIRLADGREFWGETVEDAFRQYAAEKENVRRTSEIQITMQARRSAPYRPHPGAHGLLASLMDNAQELLDPVVHETLAEIEKATRARAQFTCVRIDGPELTPAAAAAVPPRAPRSTLVEGSQNVSSSMQLGQSGASFAPQTYGGSSGSGGGSSGGHGQTWSGYEQGRGQVGGGGRMADRTAEVQPQPQIAQAQSGAARPVQFGWRKSRRTMTKEEKVEDNRERRERRKLMKVAKAKSGPGQQ